MIVKALEIERYKNAVTVNKEKQKNLVGIFLITKE